MLPSIDVLKQHISYDKNSGEFTWIKPFYHKHKNLVGKKVGSVCSHGYLETSINKQRIRLHQLAWLYSYGEIPKYIDHINQKTSDNRISNLRSVTNQSNIRNSTKSIANKSGITGVYYSNKLKKWIANICISGKSKHLGVFTKIEDAAKARKKAEQAYGFHENHGRDKKEVLC